MTTEDPGFEGIIKSDDQDVNHGIRVCIGGTANNMAQDDCSGIAILDSFGGATDDPALIFPDQAVGPMSAKDIWETISHEVRDCGEW